MHRCFTGSTGAEGIFSWTLTSLHRWYAPMPHRLNRCRRNFSWALDIVSGTKDGQCTDALSWTVGSTGACRLTWLRFPPTPNSMASVLPTSIGCTDALGVGSSGAPEPKGRPFGPSYAY